jgi:hypothetical protein
VEINRRLSSCKNFQVVVVVVVVFFTSFESLFHLMNDSKSKPFLWHPVANLNVSVAEFSESPLKWRTLGLGMMATFDA